VLYDGEPLPHFNEVDECAGLDGLMTYRVHRAMGQPVENTLHDLRWGDWDASGTVEDYVWVFLISGSAPPAHFIGGWKGASSERQPAMYFPNGGGTLKGISKPGEIVWSRIFIENDRLKMDLGRAGVVALPRGGNRAPLAGDHAAVADHARRHLRRLARPDDGPPQGEPHPGRLCQFADEADKALLAAFVTTTTVGYGDRVPVTPEGRVVAAILMCTGVGLFGTLSGLFATWLIGGDPRTATANTAAELHQLREEIAELRRLLESQSRRDRQDET
jgi:hypothetical protein